MKKLFEIRGLVTRFNTEAGLATAVDGVDFDIYEGEVLGIVGESGSGKSVTALSLTRLIPNPPGEVAEGEVLYKGRDLLQLKYSELHKIRGKEIAMIFQEPMTSLNPVFTIGYQVREIIELHEDLSRAEVQRRAVEMLELVGIPDAEKRMKDYPHQFSGGMRQRAMIAMALACNPALLIADEPTTALDVTIQAQIIELMLTVKEKRPEAAVMLITHDLAVVAETCERVIVMYGGKIQEMAEVGELFRKPLHPYTRGLLESLPRPGEKKEELSTIRGMVPSIFDMPLGCKFCTRCDLAEERCFTEEPELQEVSEGHKLRCHLPMGGSA
ncbi:MAG: ABC transporter ATP-binding protein [Candidatus Krumholzibacteria bacterium]|jgi:oligopeptide/dipeptide ABC transporter ATP-binding protein|nr:ABC transporter ATP-binding protein [Candidatus Krumholzibacteria bacterium]MDP6668706.1 ABC transporter ATP-binding protein [Candidatus Krumholzibacteria bacterium]MDP6797230.1 ABC transporter ATP-binding protein [Candidatus Krumholzibacteria bacterium]MDP7022391.1 ABC transporter ATP-binding protein [Candidatus Krumholzibacteria bacterium]